MKTEWIWYKPEDMVEMKQYYSTATNFIPLLVVFVRQNDNGVLQHVSEYPKIGYYIESLDEWRMDGSPSKWSVKWWTPMPNYPLDEEQEKE